MERKKAKQPPVKLLGCDCSLNHSGFSLVQGGEQIGYWYLTDHKAAGAKSRGRWLEPTKSKDRDVVFGAKLPQLFVHFTDIIELAKPDFAFIEGPAYGKQGMEYQLGGAHAIILLALNAAGVPARILNPWDCYDFVSSWAEKHGLDPSEDELKEIAKDENKARRIHLAETVLGFEGIQATKASPKNTTIPEDLADARIVAELGYIEFELRMGRITLAELPAGLVKAFNRVTKKNPINMLAKSWVADDPAEAERRMR